MPDNGKAQVAEQHEGQEPEPREQTAQEAVAEEPQGGAAKVFGEDYVRKLRQENAERRKRIQALQAEIEQMRSLTEQERKALEEKLSDLEAKAIEAERKYAEAVLRGEVAAAAAKRGIDPDLAWRLIDPAEVEWDEEAGKPRATEALDALVKRWPFLAHAGGMGSTSAANPPRQARVFRRSQLRDPKFFAENREAILQAMREGRIEDDLS